MGMKSQGMRWYQAWLDSTGGPQAILGSPLYKLLIMTEPCKKREGREGEQSSLGQLLGQLQALLAGIMKCGVGHTCVHRNDNVLPGHTGSPQT